MGSAANILRHKLSGEKYQPSLFRIGMTVTMDPTPFVLSAGATKVPVPQTGGGNFLVSVEAVGRMEGRNVNLTRLYVGETAFFLLHLGSDGRPDECRYFALIDEVNPADPAEWAFWLDDAEGMIGWPEFQTKDGKSYARAWAPGMDRVAPESFVETLTTASGEQSRQIEAMLYASPTHATPPAPDTEYILVAAIDAADRASVHVSAGIDVNPSLLSLA